MNGRTQPPIHPSTHSPIHPFTHSPIHTPPTHPFTHSRISSPRFPGLGPGEHGGYEIHLTRFISPTTPSILSHVWDTRGERHRLHHCTKRISNGSPTVYGVYCTVLYCTVLYHHHPHAVAHTPCPPNHGHWEQARLHRVSSCPYTQPRDRAPGDTIRHSVG